MEWLVAAGIVVCVAGLFVAGDRSLERQERTGLADYLVPRAGAEGHASALPSAFLAWFDQLLGVRTVRLGGWTLFLPSFRRSLLLSVLALSLAAAMWAAKKGFFDPEALEHGVLNPRVGIPLLVMYALGAVVSNLIPDYLSLVQSRLVLERMRRTERVSVQLGWLLIDLVLTGATVFAVLWFTAWALMPLVPKAYAHFVGCLDASALSAEEFARIYRGGLTFSSPAGTQNYDAAGIYIYSSFATSVWVWLFMGSSLLLRAATFAPPLRRALGRLGTHRQAPLRLLSLGAVIVAIALLVLPRWCIETDPGWVDGRQSWHEPMERCYQRR